MITGSCEPITWTEHANMHVRGGRSDSASSLALCQSQCVDNSDCTGVDWDTAASTNCWLHGSWSNGGMRSATGVNHYSLTRNADCNGNAVNTIAIRLRHDDDTTTTYRAHLLPILRKQNKKLSYRLETGRHQCISL